MYRRNFKQSAKSAPRPPRQTVKRGKRPPVGERPQAVVVYSRRNVLDLDAMDPVQMRISLNDLLGSQAKQAPDWWSEFKITRTKFEIVKVTTKDQQNVVFDCFVNSDAYVPSTSGEFLREQGRKTLVYVPGKTGKMSLKSLTPKYDVTGSGNQFSNINRLDVKNGAVANWHGLALMADTKVTIEYECIATVQFFGAH